jgi:hypothetical protein
MIFATDYEAFAQEIIQTVIQSGEYKPTLALVQRVGKMLENGPFITVWPVDVAEARQRARDRAHALATRRPELVLPPLPRVLPPPQLPRVLPPPQLPRVLPLP